MCITSDENRERERNNEYGKKCEKYNFFFSAFVKTKLCIIERLLSGSLVYFEMIAYMMSDRVYLFVRSFAHLNAWLVCPMDWRACVCVGQMCARSLQSSMFLMKFVWHLVCCARCGATSTRLTTVNKRWCVELAGVGLPLPLPLPLPLMCTNVKEFEMFVLRLIARASVSVEFHFILQCLSTHIFMAKKSFARGVYTLPV